MLANELSASCYTPSTFTLIDLFMATNILEKVVLIISSEFIAREDIVTGPFVWV